jgi:molecular chaperone GrpE
MSQHESDPASWPDSPVNPQARADAASASPTAEATDPAEALRKAEAQAQEYQENWLRARAESDNIRKRAQADVASAHKYAIDNFAGELLPVFDALDAALATAGASAESLRDGVELTRKQLTTAFGKVGLTVLDPTGEKFDPHHHQAMTAIESDAPAQSVLQVFQKGFKLHDRVIRPALVAVAKPREGDPGTASA